MQNQDNEKKIIIWKKKNLGKISDQENNLF